ncbi:DUF485 domain-containing protein [Sporosarcina soli]|uniref:DUF485 domain-containing protein n=1 Tax=Sporosarcina soli TaxID=334736 RepID=A0ABW0TKF5_9BACL
MSVKIDEEVTYESSSHDRNNESSTLQNDPATLDYEKLINTPEFKKLSKRKNGFLLFYTILFTAIYALLPVLTSYTTILENKAIGLITWTWIYSFGIFIMVWTLATIYTKKAAGFDKDVEEILKKTL